MRRSAKFYDIRLPAEAQAERPQPQAARHTQPGARLRPSLVRALVQHAALSSKPVLRPCLFDMNQPPLPLAEHQMLEA